MSPEVEHIGNAARLLRGLYASTPAVEFSPLKLQAVRDAMVSKGWSRMYINSQVKRLRRIFRWAASVELLPAAIHQALASVDPLKRGRTTAPDHPEVRPVDWWMVQAVLPHVSRQIGAMIKLQWLTGMRGGEVTAMRAADIDMKAKVWTYRPPIHKTSWRGHHREIALGPQAQAIIQEFLNTDTQRFLFSPADAEAERRHKLHARRKTPLSCGNKPGTNRKRRPSKRPGDRYDSSAYHHAIVMACCRAFPLPEHLQPRMIAFPDGVAKPRRETRESYRKRLTDKERAEIRAWRREHRFHPHQLRHSFATRVRREHGIEAAKILLGHKGLDMTLRYAEDDRSTAQSVAAKIG
jgi:integrase